MISLDLAWMKQNMHLCTRPVMHKKIVTKDGYICTTRYSHTDTRVRQVIHTLEYMHKKGLHVGKISFVRSFDCKVSQFAWLKRPSVSQ